MNTTSSDGEFTYTGSKATDRLMYSFWGIRIIIYILLFIISGAQSIHEGVEAKKKKTITTRSLIFICMTMFCLCRIIGDITRYIWPLDYGVGSLYYFFFSWGVFFVLIGWVFICGFWMQLLYTFHASKEINLNNTKKVRIFCYVLVGVYFCWQTPITIICLFKDITTLEAVGFFVCFLTLATGAAIFGVIFVKAMDSSQKKSKMKHFDRSIRNTKILVSTGIICVIIIVIHDVVFNFILDKKYYYFPAETFITMFADVGQQIVIMSILGGKSLGNYFLLKRVHNSLSFGSQTSGGGTEIDLSNTNNGGSKVTFNSRDLNSKDLNSRNIEVSDINSRTSSFVVEQIDNKSSATSSRQPSTEINQPVIAVEVKVDEDHRIDDDNENNV